MSYLLLIFGGLYTIIGLIQLYNYVKRRKVSELVYKSKKEQRKLRNEIRAVSEDPDKIDEILAPVTKNEREIHEVLGKMDAHNYEYGQKAFYTTLGGVVTFLFGLYLL